MVPREHTEELRRTLSAIAAYIPDRLVRAQLANPHAERIQGAFWNGSLLFADLSGFTALSERLSVLGKQGSEEVSAVVNQLFDALVAEVSAHQGMLLKFGGDALTAFFDADMLGEQHAAAATQAALAMQQRMQGFAAVATRAGTFRLGLRVGVHSGRVFGAEVGDREHIELVVTGAEVNRVAMAQEIAAPGDVVISDQTARLLVGAEATPRAEGFQHITALPSIVLPPPLPDPLSESLANADAHEVLMSQVAALRPYLVQGLPRRFLDPTIAEQGEFRPVTVLFANFYYFSALLDWLDDATTAAAVLNAYFRRAQAVVHRYGGIVNKVDMYTHGDKLMVLFGAPSTHEDDPLRAVLCALELDAALHEANAEIASLLKKYRHSDTAEQTGEPFVLQQRIGINTGTVFAGRVGGSRRHEYTVMGPAVNLAARLMSAAEEAGAILVSPATRAAVTHQIAMEDFKPLKLKGLDEPVIPSQVLHVRKSATRPRGPGHPVLTGGRQRPMIGRDAELQTLLHEATAALRGQGRVLALVGDAGIGKSRLSDELLRHLELSSLEPATAQDGNGATSFTLYAGDCQSYDQRTPYSALRSPLRELLGLPRDELPPAEQLLVMLRGRVVELAPPMVRFTPLLRDALGLALPETNLTQGLSAEQRHDRLQELVVALFVGAARQTPLVVHLDSVHWADTSSQELMDSLAQAAAGVPLLLMLNYRLDPPIAEPWHTLPDTTRMMLHDLSPQDSEALLLALLDGSPPQAVLPLLERSQGNPFFVEELVRALLDSEVLSRDGSGNWHLTGPLDQVTVPNSIEGLLLARLDRLEEQQYELVQVASVVGRRFEQPVVARVYSHPSLLDLQLTQLVREEIITAERADRSDQSGLAVDPLARRLDTGTSYLFRHALLRDVAYEGILYARRRELHRSVAQCIERLYAERLDEYLALLAQHYLLAEAWLAAFEYHLAAGRQAQHRYANRDALALFKTALRVVQNLPELLPPLLYTEESSHKYLLHILEIYQRSGDIHVLLGAYEEAQESYQGALEMVNEWCRFHGLSGDSNGQSPTLPMPFSEITVCLHRQIAIVHERRADYEQALDWIERGLQRATPDTPTELGRCYLLGAGIYQRQGHYARSLNWVQRGLQVIKEQHSHSDMAHAYYTLGGTYSKLGRTQEAITAVEQSLHLYEEIGHIDGQANAHINLSNVLADSGNWRAAISHGQSAMELKETIGDVHGQAIIANNLGDLKRHMGDYESAMEYFHIALEKFYVLGSDYGMAVLHMNMGSVSLRQGFLPATRYHLDESKRLFAQTGTQEFLAELYAIYAELALAEKTPQEGLQWVEQSLALAQQLNARADEGMARRIRGVMLRTLGRRQEALDELRTACTILKDTGNQLAVASCLEELAITTENRAESEAALDEAQRIRLDAGPAET